MGGEDLEQMLMEAHKPDRWGHIAISTQSLFHHHHHTNLFLLFCLPSFPNTHQTKPHVSLLSATCLLPPFFFLKPSQPSLLVYNLHRSWSLFLKISSGSGRESQTTKISMQGAPGVGAGGGGGAVSGGGGSITSGGSMSTVSKEDNLVLSSEDSSSCPDESELELGLGLSLGGACRIQQGPRGQYARILTAKDFPYLGSLTSASSSASSSSSSSCSNSSLSRANVTAGTKRSADSVAVANGASQVVGWPPIRAYRINSLVNQAKLPAAEVFNPLIGKSKNSNTVVGKGTGNGGDKNNGNAKERGQLRSTQFVKVNMDGIPIGRKVDLSAHSCYETLSQKLEDMFQTSTTIMNSIRSSKEEDDMMVGATRPSKLLDGSSEFVLTYEDKDGDWMLVGDVPWGMFISSVRRLRIMRTSEANGLAPRSEERNGRQRTNPI